jgi:hypothetical protein
MKFFLTNFLVTLSAYGLIIFVYPSEAIVVPRICLMWAAPVLGTLAALLVTRISLPGHAFGAEALAIYTITGIYCVVYHQGARYPAIRHHCVLSARSDASSARRRLRKTHSKIMCDFVLIPTPVRRDPGTSIRVLSSGPRHFAKYANAT